MKKMTVEQKLAWGRTEFAIMNYAPKSHAESMNQLNGHRIRREAIGATAAEARQLMKDAFEHDNRSIAEYMKGALL